MNLTLETKVFGHCSTEGLLKFSLKKMNFAGMAIRHWNGTMKMVSAEIKMNPDSRKAIHLNLVLHELGHMLTLDHTNNVESIMYHKAGPGRRVFSRDDIHQMKEAYVFTR